MNIHRLENLYALKYILEHEGKSVSSEVLIAAMQSLYPQDIDKIFLKEAPIKLEWQLRTVIIILEQLCERESQFTCQFLDDARKAISVYKKTHKKIMQHGGKVLKSNCAEFNKPDGNIKSFKCNFDNKYLFKVIKNTLNSICDDRNYQQTGFDRAIAALNALLLSAPTIVKMGP